MFLLRGMLGRAKPFKLATNLAKRSYMVQNRYQLSLMRAKSLNTRNMLSLQMYRWFATQTATPLSYMKNLSVRNCKTPEEVKQELDQVNKLFEDYEDFIEDVELVGKYMETIIERMKTMRTPPLAEYILSLNNCIEKSQQLERFEECWKQLEKLCFNQISFISSENTITLVYYFCKYQKTSKIFWSRFDSKLSTDIKLLNNSELLSKLLLALIMDQKDNQEIYKQILTKLVELMDKASSRDCFFIAVSLARNIIDFETIPTDLYYTLYLNTVQFIDQYNLSELSYFLLLFSSPSVQEHIPKEFWVNVVELQLMQAIGDFKAHREEIEVSFFLDDFTRCFMSHVVSEKASDKIWEAVSEVMIKDIDSLNELTIENLIYSMVRSRRKDEKLWNILVFATTQRRLVIDDKINEFCLLLGNSRNEIYLKINMKFLIYAVILMAMMASVHSWNKIEHKTGKELLHVLEGGYVQRNRAPRLSRNENP